MLTYRTVVQLGVPLVPLLLRDDRQRAAHRARLAAPAAVERWGRERRDPTRPLAWFHASSVGEGLQARAVIQALRARLPDLQLVYTHHSPSAESLAASVGADWSGYLCYDRRADVDRMLAAAAPDLLVFTKLDLWPQLSVRAAARGTCVTIVAATVSPASGRLRWPARPLATPGYAAVQLAIAADADDCPRLEALGCQPARIVVGGDPRIDAVLDAVANAAPLPEGARGLDPSATLVAGSTWPADEAVLLRAFAAVRQSHPRARLVLVPHDLAAARLQSVESAAHRAGLPRPLRLSATPDTSDAPVIVVDRYGVLARLYACGLAAYVGGGFGRKGIHSVFEPAAAGRPVVIGPHDRGNRDAALLETAGALIRLRQPGAIERLVSVWTDWLDRPDTAGTQGRAAYDALSARRGAADRTADMLVEALRVRP